MLDPVVWLLLLFATCLCAVGMALDFTLNYHDKWWFAPTKVCLGVLGSLTWTICLWRIGDKQKIYMYGLMWDVIICAVAYFVPVIFFGIHLSWKGVIGIAFMTAGLILLKL